jgi:hypothetical protein
MTYFYKPASPFKLSNGRTGFFLRQFCVPLELLREKLGASEMVPATFLGFKK